MTNAIDTIIDFFAVVIVPIPIPKGYLQPPYSKNEKGGSIKGKNDYN